MKPQDFEEFCRRWLVAWTGNQPERLIEFYSDDVLYRDPARPDGITGKTALFDYLRKLLRKNPAWVWSAKEVIPTGKGFVLKWTATIPVGPRTVIVEGLDIVEVSGEQISRNEVFFDRSVLPEA
jgi:hypothetical protein